MKNLILGLLVLGVSQTSFAATKLTGEWKNKSYEAHENVIHCKIAQLKKDQEKELLHLEPGAVAKKAL